MGIFDAWKKKSAEDTATPVAPVATTVSPELPEQRNKLETSKVDLSKAINLTKEKTGTDITSMQARVAVVMDISGSMDWMYQNGRVQNILTRLLPFALQFDDNGELEVYIFANDCKQVEPSMTVENYSTYVKDKIMSKYRYGGGTNYAPAVAMTDKIYNDDVSKNMPTLVLFITDGDNFDEDETNAAITESAKYGIFYMFIGIGKSRFQYLQSLDDLPGRVCDNTGLMLVNDFEVTNNVEIFMQSLKDYIPWLKVKGYIT